MRVLVFRHVPFEDAGLIEPVLERHGLRVEYADLYRDPAASPDWGSADGLVFMGGPMSANDPLPFINRELEILRQALADSKPVLGVCLGAQMLARAAGARVYSNAVKEIGWYPVTWTDAAASDELFQGLPSPAMLFHWHGETFDLPPRAVRLAGSDACRNQAFRLGTAYGLQFHLEVTPEMIAGWCQEDANAGDVRELGQPIDPTAHSDLLAELAEVVFGRWAPYVTNRLSKFSESV